MVKLNFEFFFYFDADALPRTLKDLIPHNPRMGYLPYSRPTKACVFIVKAPLSPQLSRVAPLLSAE